MEMEAIGIRRVLTHSEKGAAYMADGYARVAGRPSICMAQSVGAANLAAGLQDSFLGGSPVIALTPSKSLLVNLLADPLREGYCLPAVEIVLFRHGALFQHRKELVDLLPGKIHMEQPRAVYLDPLRAQRIEFL